MEKGRKHYFVAIDLPVAIGYTTGIYLQPQK